MPTTIKLKNSVTTTNVPSSLAQGEVAINVTDKKVWVGNAATTPVQLLGTGSDGSFTNLTVSGTTALNGGTTLGDASGDALTINSSAVSIPNGLNFDSNTFVIDATNNRVGVGTASPAVTVDVKAASANIFVKSTTAGNNSSISTDTSSTDVASIYAPSINGSVVGYIGAGGATYPNLGGNNSLFFYNMANGPAVFATNATERMRITSTGNVGIGTSTPGTKLEIDRITTASASATGSTTRSNSIAALAASTDTNSRLMFGIDSSTYGWIQAQNTSSNAASSILLNPVGGNVGIGTSSPNDKLEITGAFGNQFRISRDVDTGQYSEITGGGGSMQFTSRQMGDNEFKWISINNATSTTRMTLDSTGNLGVGVTPSAWVNGKALQIGSGRGGSFFVEQVDFGFASLNANAFYSAQSTWNYVTTNAASRYNQLNGVHSWLTAPAGTAGNPITFTQAMTLDASGNLGIGTTSPSRKLHISGGASVTYLQLSNDASGNTNADGFQIYQDGTTVALINRENGYMSFDTNNTERMRIDSSGNLLVGTTTVTSQGWVQLTTSNTKYSIVSRSSVSGAGAPLSCVNSAGTEVGSITFDNTVTLYNTTSDYRLKTVVAPVTNAGIRIDALEPIEYDWNAGGRTRGFLAHKFAEVYPNSVSGEKDAIDEEGKPKYQAMQASTPEVMADLIAEIQSLRKRVAQLESK